MSKALFRFFLPLPSLQCTFVYINKHLQVYRSHSKIRITKRREPTKTAAYSGGVSTRLPEFFFVSLVIYYATLTTAKRSQHVGRQVGMRAHIAHSKKEPLANNGDRRPTSSEASHVVGGAVSGCRNARLMMDAAARATSFVSRTAPEITGLPLARMRQLNPTSRRPLDVDPAPTGVPCVGGRKPHPVGAGAGQAALVARLQKSTSRTAETSYTQRIHSLCLEYAEEAKLTNRGRHLVNECVEWEGIIDIDEF